MAYMRYDKRSLYNLYLISLLDAATRAEISPDWLARIRTGQAAPPSGAAPTKTRRMLMRPLRSPMVWTRNIRDAALAALFPSERAGGAGAGGAVAARDWGALRQEPGAGRAALADRERARAAHPRRQEGITRRSASLAGELSNPGKLCLSQHGRAAYRVSLDSSWNTVSG